MAEGSEPRGVPPPALEPGSIDWLLTTTRTVRRRLDLTRPVDPGVVLDCLELALQAPTGGDLQLWRWIVVTDPLTKSRMREIYQSALLAASGGHRPAGPEGVPEARPEGMPEARSEGMPAAETAGERMLEGAWHLATHLDRVPVIVVACIKGRPAPDATPARLAARYGSIYPAVWSLQLALRSRGLASAMTTVHLEEHRAMAELLGIPANVTQAALVPVAHLLGRDLRPARRRPARDVAFAERWGGEWRD